MWITAWALPFAISATHGLHCSAIATLPRISSRGNPSASVRKPTGRNRSRSSSLNHAAAVVAASPRRPPLQAPFTVAILLESLGDVPQRTLRHLAGSPPASQLELTLSGSGARASRAQAKLRGLLEAVESVVVGAQEKDDGLASAATRVVAGCPALLLLDGKELLNRGTQLRDMEGVTEETAAQLAVEYPGYFTLPPAARARIGFFVGKVGLTAKDVGRLAKRRPDVIENIGGGHVRRLVDLLLEDLHVGKAALLRMVRRQPGLLSLSVSGNVLKVTEFFKKEMGLKADQISKIYCSNPHVLCLSLEKNIRPVVDWLGAPDPEAQQQQQQQQRREGSPSHSGTRNEEKARPSPSSHPPPATAATNGGGGGGGSASVRQTTNPSGLDRKSGRDRIAAATTAGFPDDAGELTLRRAAREEVAAVGQGAGPEPQRAEPTLAVPVYTEGVGWGWGLGFGREERRKIVCKQGDLLWKSVVGNLAKSASWFVEEVGLSWDEMRKVVERSPSLLCLSAEHNLEPKLAFLVNELGLDPGSVRKAMRAAGAPPAFRHLRALCNYPEDRFSAWLERIVLDADDSSSPATASSAVSPSRPRPGRRLGGDADDPPTSSLSTTSLAELGLTYAAATMNAPRRQRREAAGAAAGEAEEQRAAFFFAPGRAEVKALVRKLARGLDVLDLMCGTGGFALNAAAGGARSVIGVDKAARAVRTATKNARANGLDDAATFLKADVAAFAGASSSSAAAAAAAAATAEAEAEASGPGERKAWDLVVVDPPSFLAKSARSTARAVKAFTRLAESVALVVRPSGGMLVVVYEPGDGVFDTPEEMTAVFTSAASAAGVSLSLSLLEARSARPPATGGEENASSGSSGNDSKSRGSAIGGTSSSSSERNSAKDRDRNISNSGTGVLIGLESLSPSPPPAALLVANQGSSGGATGGSEAAASSGARQGALLRSSSGRREAAAVEGVMGAGGDEIESGGPAASSPPPWFALYVCSRAPPSPPPPADDRTP
ncbi:conserved unknown protein [Ectocarpus siliculosus]|uniref:Methyltransferase domain-containing protein n=1 Tax=Ectocarpus siliculosus TaxID=2880 RepID=D8LEJ3_ECTSI|nr:conserved unknown protein [Ectocarpus siliculosus]|eukprot:CBN80236.1 conserved unknown protein [Ectocarpus siliculosus]